MNKETTICSYPLRLRLPHKNQLQMSLARSQMTLATTGNSPSVICLCSSPCNKTHSGAIPDSCIQQQDIVSGGKHRKVLRSCQERAYQALRRSFCPLSRHMVVNSHWEKRQALVSLQPCAQAPSPFYAPNSNHCWHQCSHVYMARRLSDLLKPL